MKTQPTDIPRISPLHGTLLVLRQGRSLLLIRRAKEPYKGLLALPGGKIEEGETPLETARREMLEETGLKRPKPKWLGRVTDLLIEGEPPFSCFILDVFEVKLDEGVVPQPSFEGTIVRVPLADIPFDSAQGREPFDSASRRVGIERQTRADEIIPADLIIIWRLVIEHSTTMLDLVSVRTPNGYDVKVV